MTPEERAEKLKEKLCGECWGEEEILLVAAQIHEAIEEDRASRCSDDLYKSCYAKGKAEAYEDAAKIAHTALAIAIDELTERWGKGENGDPVRNAVLAILKNAIIKAKALE